MSSFFVEYFIDLKVVEISSVYVVGVLYEKLCHIIQYIHIFVDA